jgi:hypothetical protein
MMRRIAIGSAKARRDWNLSQQELSDGAVQAVWNDPV